MHAMSKQQLRSAILFSQLEPRSSPLVVPVCPDSVHTYLTCRFAVARDQQRHAGRVITWRRAAHCRLAAASDRRVQLTRSHRHRHRHSSSSHSLSRSSSRSHSRNPKRWLGGCAAARRQQRQLAQQTLQLQLQLRHRGRARQRRQLIGWHSRQRPTVLGVRGDGWLSCREHLSVVCPH